MEIEERAKTRSDAYSRKTSTMIIVMNRQLIENGSSTMIHDLISNAMLAKFKVKAAHSELNR